MRGTQRFVATTLLLVGVALALGTGVVLYRRFCGTEQFAENVILIEESRSESRWVLVETARGHLIRARNGRFQGWYLAYDDLVNPIERVTTPLVTRLGFRVKPGPYVRNLYLRERAGPDGYWRITETEQGTHLQATHGRYEDWYLDFLGEYVPDIGSDPRTAWNLVLNENPVPGASWRLKPTDGGYTIQATTGPFDGWYLDSLQEANVFERSPCWDEEARKDRQTPPLLKP